MYKLSICIPTYNRADFIGSTLRSIVSQADPRVVEIVICDNASMDHTSEVVAEYRMEFPSITYKRHEANLGADRNYLAVVEHANGEFCWLLGSDDWLEQGAIDAVLNTLSEVSPDVMMHERTLMTFEMTNGRPQKMLALDRGTLFDGSLANGLDDYWNAAIHVGSFFTYLSCLVVRRSSWHAVVTKEQFIGSVYIHVSKIFEMLADGGKLYYLNQPLVKTRLGNDSFASDGQTRRYLIEFGLLEIADASFPDGAARRAIIRVLAQELFNIKRLLWQKLKSIESRQAGDFQLLKASICQYFKDERFFTLKYAIFLLTPIVTLARLRRLLRS